jgi:two-component system, cell cycle response regulator
MHDIRDVGGARECFAHLDESGSVSTSVRCGAPARGACQVLVVEDEGLVAKDLARSLIRFGYNVVARAATGDEAIRLAALLQPDLILMDICLRGRLDGVATATLIHEKAATPVVFLTAFSDKETLDRAMAAQPFGFVVKPFQEVALRCALEVAISRHRREEEVRASEQAFRRLSSIDELTGLPNRRGFCELASQQLKISLRYHQPLVLCFADLDGLEKINDSLGHAVGDDAICAAATVLRETFRDADIVGRLSGDEFAVLAIAGSPSHIGCALRRLSTNLADFNAAPTPFTLDLSLGMVQHDAALDECLDDLLGRADAALYEQKQRKRCSAASPPNHDRSS